MGPASKIRLVFIDEYSFISQTHLAAISLRCQQTSRNTTRPFGDYHVVLVGDPRQHESPRSSPLLKGAAAEMRWREAGCDTQERERPAALPVDGVEEDADGGDDTADKRARRAAALLAKRRASDSVGRHAFLSMSRVFNLTEQMRVNDTMAGHTLRKHASLFMGNERASKADVVAFCDAFNAKTVHSIDDVLPHMPRVVTQRQKARAAIGFNLALRVSAALGKRATVWLSTHTRTVNGCVQPCSETLQRALRRNININDAAKLPAALVFFEVRVLGRA